MRLRYYLQITAQHYMIIWYFGNFNMSYCEVSERKMGVHYGHFITMEPRPSYEKATFLIRYSFKEAPRGG